MTHEIGPAKGVDARFVNITRVRSESYLFKLYLIDFLGFWVSD